MKGVTLNYALIFAVILQAIGLIWYVSKLDSKVETVYEFYQEESQKSVVETQVKMKFDLALVMRELQSIKEDIKEGKDKSKVIMAQHGKIFELLQGNVKIPSGYNYQ